MNVYTKLHLHNYIQCQQKYYLGCNYHEQLSEIWASEGRNYEVYTKLTVHNSYVLGKSYKWWNCDMWS